MNKIILISQDGCRPCGFVKNYLENEEVSYDLVNVSKDKDYIDKYSIMSTPVTILLDENNEEIDRVEGFNHPLINSLIEQL